jgi:hypothetical protein
MLFVEEEVVGGQCRTCRVATVLVCAVIACHNYLTAPNSSCARIMIRLHEHSLHTTFT